MTTFRTALQGSAGTATGIPVPEEVVLGLGAGKRVPIVVTLGDYSYRTTVGPYRGQYMIPVSAERRTAAGVAAGDQLTVTIEVDTAPRIVEVPEDLARALAGVPAAKARFEAIGYSHQRAHVLSVEDAKTPETRARRVAKVLGALGS